MAENNNILEKLDGLEARYEEVSTLITDPSVIADQQRYVKLTKEYKDLEDIMKLRQKYINCLNGIAEAKDIIMNEQDAEMKEMAREELAVNEELQPKLEEEIKIALVPKDPEDAKNVQMEIRAGTGGDEACRRDIHDVQEILRVERLDSVCNKRERRRCRRLQGNLLRCKRRQRIRHIEV